ncbi:MAG: hypothetical protein R2880_11255 [Deinococcales bacterium]
MSIRISILNMMMSMRENLGVTMIFITHDLALAKYFAWQGRIAVMYLGRIIELGKPQHHPRPPAPLYPHPAFSPTRTRPR